MVQTQGPGQGQKCTGRGEGGCCPARAARDGRTTAHPHESLPPDTHYLLRPTPGHTIRQHPSPLGPAPKSPAALICDPPPHTLARPHGPGHKTGNTWGMHKTAGHATSVCHSHHLCSDHGPHRENLRRPVRDHGTPGPGGLYPAGLHYPGAWRAATGRVWAATLPPPPPNVCLTGPGGGGGGRLAGGHDVGLFAFGDAYWPLALAHSDPLWVRTCFGRVNGAPA